jgi:hypothetical protein
MIGVISSEPRKSPLHRFSHPMCAQAGKVTQQATSLQIAIRYPGRIATRFPPQGQDVYRSQVSPSGVSSVQHIPVNSGAGRPS